MQWSGKDGTKLETPIELVPCESLMPYDLPLSTKFSEKRSRSKPGKASYLCPDTENSKMIVQGSYHDEHFQYIRLSFRRCNKAKPLLNGQPCLGDEEVAKNKTLRIYMPEASVNYDIHDHDKAVEWSLHSFYTL